jgi:methylated-DNA-[protein]-cysteine S-methyltransferase
VRARFTQYAVPDWGVGELWTRDDVVLAHEFRFGAVSDTEVPTPAGVSRPDSAATDSRRMVDSDPRPGCGTNGTHLSPVRANKNRCLTPPDLVERFRAFFDGAETTFDDVELDLEWATPFQRNVAAALRAVPRGEVVSYGELAALAGYPGAARAAGTFCAHNRFMIIVPCHRVVGASGLGGYGSAGVDTKRRLLALEGVLV